MSERANALAIGTAFDPVTAEIDPLVSVEPAPAVQPPDAPFVQREAAAAADRALYQAKRDGKDRVVVDGGGVAAGAREPTVVKPA